MTSKIFITGMVSLMIASPGAPLWASPQGDRAGEASLRFDPKAFTARTVEVDGQPVKYRFYEGVVYVSKPLDRQYQSMNIYVPEGAASDQKVPIILRTYVGGYMPALPGGPGAELMAAPDRDIAAPALKRGYVVVSPGSRGSVSRDAAGRNIGKAPALIADLKAAIRYLRYNDALIPGDSEKIIIDGTSAGGAAAAIIGASGNNPLYKPYLEAMGAAEARDDVYASVCFCPITDLEHADMAYEWLYNRLNDIMEFSPAQKAVSDELKAQFPAYQRSLGLTRDDGELLTAGNYEDYIKVFVLRSAQKAIDKGADVSSLAWLTVEDGKAADLDFEAYIQDVGRWAPVKNPPAFDNLGINTAEEEAHIEGSRENLLFGDAASDALNFTDYSLQKNTGDPEAAVAESVKSRRYLMNPMNFIGDAESAVTKNWYIRHGTKDRDTSFMIPINLYSKLSAAGYAVNFALGWEMPHTGDYEQEELFAWLESLR